MPSFMPRRMPLASAVATNAAQLGRLVESLSFQESDLRCYEEQILQALRDASLRRKGFQEELDASSKRVQEICELESQVLAQLDALTADDNLYKAKELELQKLQEEKRQEESGSKRTKCNARQFERDQVFKKRSLVQVQVDLVRIRQQKQLLAATAVRVGVGSRFLRLHK